MAKERLSIVEIKEKEYKGDILMNKIGIAASIISAISGLYSSFSSINERNYVDTILYLLIGIIGSGLAAHLIDTLIKKIVDKKAEEQSKEIDMLRYETKEALKKLDTRTALTVDKYYEINRKIDKSTKR